MPRIDLYFFFLCNISSLPLCGKWKSVVFIHKWWNIILANYWVTCKKPNYYYFYYSVKCERKSRFLCSNIRETLHCVDQLHHSLDPHCLLVSAPTHSRLSCQVFMPPSVCKVHFHPIRAQFCPSVETQTNRTNYLRPSPVCFL